MKEAYKTQVHGHWILFTASCLCEAKQKQKQFKGENLRPFPIEDYEMMKQINKNLSVI